MTPPGACSRSLRKTGDRTSVQMYFGPIVGLRHIRKIFAHGSRDFFSLANDGMNDEITNRLQETV